MKNAHNLIREMPRRRNEILSNKYEVKTFSSADAMHSYRANNAGDCWEICEFDAPRGFYFKQIDCDRLTKKSTVFLVDVFMRKRYALRPIAAKPVTEATPAGNQYIIPGCERRQAPGAAQLELLI
jgi:hypothetical protein